MVSDITDEQRKKMEEHIRKYPPRPEDYEAAQYFDSNSDALYAVSIIYQKMLNGEIPAHGPEWKKPKDEKQ